MTMNEAQKILIDVATKRKPHSRTALMAAVEVLETPVKAKPKKATK